MTDAELRDAAVAELKATTITYPEWVKRVENGYKGKPYDPAKTSWGRAFAHLALIESVAPPPPPPPPPPPTGDPIPADGRITRGGTYTGTHTSSSPIVIDTDELVTIVGATITRTGGADVFRGLGGGFTIRRLVLDRCTIHGSTGRVFDAEGIVDITVRQCSIFKTGGMKFASSNAKVLVTRTRIENIQGSLLGGPSLAQFTQFAEMSGTLEVSWNEIVNDDPEGSFAEDLISLFKTSGAYVHDNYFYGQWTPGNPTVSSQNGITVEETGSSNNRIHDNILVATMGGPAVFQNVGTGNEIMRNRVVRAGFLPDGVTRTRAGYSGLGVFTSGNHAHGNVVGFVGSSGRVDWEDDDLPSDCLPLNTHYPGQVTMASERAEWDRWQAKLVAAGVTVGT